MEPEVNTVEEKSLIIYADIGNISKIADNGKEYRGAVKDKPDLGFDYVELQFVMLGDEVKYKEYLSGKEGDGWGILSDEQIEAVIKYIDAYIVPASFYPTYWNNVMGALHNSLSKYLDKTMIHLFDLVEDGTPIPDNVRANRKFIKGYLPLLEDETIKDAEAFNNVLLQLKNAPTEVIENTTKCIKQSIPEYDLKQVIDG